MLVQIHKLQNYAPSNLNRDDSGSPKSAMFGGHQRGRISSQCIKRSIRTSDTFREAFAADDLLGSRTRRLPLLVDAALVGMGVDDETRQTIVARVPEIGQESGRDQNLEDKTNTRQLIFIGAGEDRAIAEKLLALFREAGPTKWRSLKIDEITKELGSSLPKSVDIAMFGRMTTSSAFEDVQAAVQVAHAVSANAITSEYDYFTAVDDLKPREEDAGAGMIGDVEFNSSTYYQYFNVHWDQLVKNLGGDADMAARAVVALLQAAVTAQPSGKQNTFAAYNLPDLVLVEVSDGNVPVSYANAFLEPANNRGGSLMDNAVRKLDEYAGQLRAAYGLNGNRAFFAVADRSLSDAEDVGNLAALQDWLAAQIRGRLEAQNG